MSEDETVRSIVAALGDAAEHVGDPAAAPLLTGVVTRYAGLSPAGRLELMRWLAEELETSADVVAALPPLRADDPQNLLAWRNALQAPRLRILREFVNVRGGIKFLVDLRAELLQMMRRQPELVRLKTLDADLLDLFRGWFNFGFLQLVPIAWETTSAAQLEKLMAYDVVHPMTSWDDLRRRLDRDRTCYAFYHPNMPDEPLVFVEIALTRTIASSIDRIMAPRKEVDAAQATAAIFYSINSTQPGLAGVSLGNSLIKMVVQALKQRYPNLKRFSTLSPIPTFRRWVERVLAEPNGMEPTPDDVAAMFEGHPTPAAVRAWLADDGWAREPERALRLKAGLLRLAHHYLTREKRAGRPADPVAQFHLKNGATLYNINFLSNTAGKGMAESYGLTANYWYDLATIEKNQQAFRQGRVIIAPQLERLLKLGVSA